MTALWLVLHLSDSDPLYLDGRLLYRRLMTILRGEHPLVEANHFDETLRGTLTLLPAGREVLEGRADHIALNGIDRWLGGVHLKGNRVGWRWDPDAGRINRF